MITTVMKKLYFFVLLFFSLLYTLPSKAQLSVKHGISGGLIMKELEIEKIGSFDSEISRQGWFAGPTLEIGLPLGIKVDGSVLYTHHELECGSEKVGKNYITIPLNLKLCIGLPKMLAFYLSGGFQFDNQLGEDDKSLISVNGENFRCNKDNRSWNVGAGLRLLNRLQLGITYNILGKEKDEDLSYNNFDYRKNSWRVGLTMLF